MIVPQKEIKSRTVNSTGKWHLKIVDIGDKLNEKKNSYIRVTCLSHDDKLFHFPIYPNDNGMELLSKLARCAGDVCITEDGDIDSSKLVGTFIYAILGEYTGESSLYEDGYYIKDVWASFRRYDKTGSWIFNRVRQSGRRGSTYKS